MKPKPKAAKAVSEQPQPTPAERLTAAATRRTVAQRDAGAAAERLNESQQAVASLEVIYAACTLANASGQTPAEAPAAVRARLDGARDQLHGCEQLAARANAVLTAADAEFRGAERENANATRRGDFEQAIADSAAAAADFERAWRGAAAQLWRVLEMRERLLGFADFQGGNAAGALVGRIRAIPLQPILAGAAHQRAFNLELYPVADTSTV